MPVTNALLTSLPDGAARMLTQQHLDTLASDLGDEDTMLIYCTRRVRGLKLPDNIEVKKIPRDLLAKCPFEETQ
jgi:adenine-specific DNA-methyltransferase